MKHLIVILLFFIFSCRDVEHLPSIDGAWRQTAPASPGWIFIFENGIITQRIDKFGGTITALQFTYAQRGDTLYIGGDEHNGPRLWLVTLLGECDMKARQRPDDPGQREWDVLYFERL